MQDEVYMNRCFELAKLGGKNVRPNPQVGAVLVYNNRIIGEGYHQVYGGPHAEVNAVKSVKDEDLHLLKKSTLYVSLEPCCHMGKTPPCTDLIRNHKIPKVVIGEIDPTDKVNAKGVARLREYGVDVNVMDVSNPSTTAVFKRNHVSKRPFVQLKFAKSKDNYIGQQEQQVWLTNPYTGVFTHKLRSQTDGILVGTNTALIDDPSLTLRNYPGKAPVRIVLDRNKRIPSTHKLFSNEAPTFCFTQEKSKSASHVKYIEFDFEEDHFIDRLLEAILELEIFHIMVEGGAQLLRSFVAANLWDEAIILHTPKRLQEGIKAPNVQGTLHSTFKMDDDTVFQILNT